jgi:hypothetical protein
MSYRVYAKAIGRIEERGSVTGVALADKLIAYLKARGREKLLPKILAELRAREAKEHVRRPLLEVASEKEKHEALRLSKEAGIETSNARVNHTLIRGWRAKGNGVLVDASAKRSLLQLYRNITS